MVWQPQKMLGHYYDLVIFLWTSGFVIIQHNSYKFREEIDTATGKHIHTKTKQYLKVTRGYTQYV